MFIAADTSALVALSAIERLDLLRLHFPQVWLPPEIVSELITRGAGWKNAAQAQLEFSRSEWLLPWVHPFPLLNPPSRKLGTGEIEAISLAFQQKGICLMDDRRGRAYAASLGIRVLGAPGVLRISKLFGAIPAVKPALLEMVRKGIFYSPDLISQILTDLGE